MLKRLNCENLELSKQVVELRKENEIMSSDVLLKSQIIEENRINFIQEKRQLESDFDGLNHKYDRKELIL